VANVGKIVDKVDGFQQRHAWAAIPFGVYKKFSEDQAGNLAALISYYAFFSIFPLLLALTTILGFVLSGDPTLSAKIYNGAAGSIPLISQNSSQHPLKGSVFALVFGVLVAIWSGLAVASQAQSAFNVVWTIPRVDRPGFLPRIVRNLELVAVVGGGLIITTLIQGLISNTAKYGLNLGIGVSILGAVVGIVLNIGLLMVLYRRGTARELSWRDVFPGAIVGGIGWFVLQKVGSEFINSKVAGDKGTYGTFAVVIGLLSYFYLLSQITLYAAEINVVVAEKLWPRGLRALQGVATTDADERAYSAYPERERQAHDTAIGVDVDKQPDGQTDPADPNDPDDPDDPGSSRGRSAAPAAADDHSGTDRSGHSGHLGTDRSGHSGTTASGESGTNGSGDSADADGRGPVRVPGGHQDLSEAIARIKARDRA
jgi:membrane protein